MFAIDETFAYNDSLADYPIVKPNIRTGDGRRIKLRIGSTKQGDQKKKQHRKMAKKSRRANRK
jgi:hypothetical protein